MSVFESKRWPGVEAELVAMLNAPGRSYHNLSHVRDCLDQLEMIPNLDEDDRELLELAIWFHDAIYDPTRSDNEAASAQLARLKLSKMGVSEEKIHAVMQLIEITEHRSQPTTENEKRMVDIDLSILGRDSDRYSAYAEAVRKEYGHVSGDDYCTGRCSVLRGFLEREFIFETRCFRERYEKSARENLAAEISRLES